MHSQLPAALALLAGFTAASPIVSTPAEIRGLADVLSITNLDYEWHTPTANDLHVISGNGSYYSDADGFPLSGDISKRQSGTYITNSALVGNGDPHQNPYQQQQSSTLSCGPGGSCSVSIMHSHSLSWSASANAEYGWISGGFGVSETYTSGQTLTCDGNAGGDVCVWYSYGVTAYTVSSTSCYYFNGAASMCRNLGTRTLFSPNNCQQAQPYCVRGSACRNENDGYYATANAPAGGPPC